MGFRWFEALGGGVGAGGGGGGGGWCGVEIGGGHGILRGRGGRALELMLRGVVHLEKIRTNL